MQNYHKHTCYSNVFIADSAATYNDYAKRAVELGHKVISSVEHGWQSNYYIPYGVAKKHGLKFIFGTEAYWVKDRKEKDRTNGHIVILAKNEKGRRAINLMLADANEDGYYYRPRVDLELLLALPKDDVFITTACVAFWQYEDIEEIVLKLHEYFQDNFMLEIQYHDTDKQIKLNQRIKELAYKNNIEMIVGLDSHYIYEEDAKQRDYVLKAKNVSYPEEDGWFMDYPDDKTVIKRFIKQDVFSIEEIEKAMDNTDVCLKFEDIEFSTDIKLPSAYPDKTQEERNKIYSRLVTAKFKEYTKDMTKEVYDEYYQGVKKEVDVYKETGMVDYPLIDYRIVQRAIEKGGLITNSGRGSAVGYFTNTLCGFSKVDRFRSSIKLYPERFISKSRILETKSLPDLDLNCGNPEIFAEAQDEVLTEIYGTSNHSYPMIAFGTFKKKSAFKLYARAKDLDFEIANKISEQIGKYDTAVTFASDDERDDLDIYDYVDEEYHDYVTQSKPYWGIVSDKKKAPCAYLIYEGDIREEIGLMKCKSESTKKEYMTTVIDGAVAEEYKFLKNDLLKVDVVVLIEKVFKRIGMNNLSVNELQEKVRDDKKVWDLYRKGYTLGLNQCEKDKTTEKVMRYKPTNISELTAFIAAIRPAFKSMYSKFESRQPFSYGIDIFDNIIQTDEFPYSFILYQEQTMNTLNYAGFPIDECYGIIKAIAKKHPEKVRPLKAKFIDGFKQRIVEDSNASEEEAVEMSDKVWQIIDDSCGYGFNSAHAYCMALDSLYNAWQKAHYPYEFYEVLLQHYSDKGNKEKVALLKQEMWRAFKIREGEYRFGADNRKFVASQEDQTIYSSLLSIKRISQTCANDLYKLSQKKTYDSFYGLYKDMKKVKSLNKTKIEVLIKIGYFKDFASIGKLLKFVSILEELYERSQFSRKDVKREYRKYIEKYSKETEKQYREFDYDKALYEIWDDLEESDLPINQQMSNELEFMGYIKTKFPNLSDDYVFVQAFECKFKNPKLTLYRLHDGSTKVVKVKRNAYDKSPILEGTVIKAMEIKDEGRWSLDENGDWQQDNGNKEPILKKWSQVR